MTMTERIEKGTLKQALCERVAAAGRLLEGGDGRIPSTAGAPQPLWITMSNVAVLSVIQKEYTIATEVPWAKKLLADPDAAGRRGGNRVAELGLRRCCRGRTCRGGNSTS